MKLIFFFLLFVSCTVKNNANHKNMNEANENNSKVLTLYYEEAKESNAKYSYFVDSVYSGNDEKGFKEFLKMLDNKIDINTLIVSTKLSLTNDGKSFQESLPFFYYDVGYRKLIEICESKGITIEYKFL